jgi:hypothetical protein
MPAGAVPTSGAMANRENCAIVLPMSGEGKTVRQIEAGSWNGGRIARTWCPNAMIRLRVPPASWSLTRLVAREYMPTCAEDIYALAADCTRWSTARINYRMVYDARRHWRPYLAPKTQLALTGTARMLADPEITVTATVTDLHTHRPIGAWRAQITGV